MKNFLVIINVAYTSGLDTFTVSARDTADAVQQLERMWSDDPAELETLASASICPMTEVLTLPIGNWKRKYVKPQSS